MDDFDLDAYLRRIGHAGPHSATFETLHQAHTAAQPFENLDPPLGVPVALGIASPQRKLDLGRRAGPAGRRTLRDNRLTCHAADGPRQVHVLTSRAEMLEVLEETFGIDLAGLKFVGQLN